MAVRALLAVAGVLSLVQAAPEDPQSRSMIPQGIITADMFKTARQEAARKLALPPAVQVSSAMLHVRQPSQPAEEGRRLSRNVQIDLDNVPVIEGVRVPDDPKEKNIIYRNARIINNVLVTDQDPRPEISHTVSHGVDFDKSPPPSPLTTATLNSLSSLAKLVLSTSAKTFAQSETEAKSFPQSEAEAQGFNAIDRPDPRPGVVGFRTPPPLARQRSYNAGSSGRSLPGQFVRSPIISYAQPSYNLVRTPQARSVQQTYFQPYSTFNHRSFAPRSGSMASRLSNSRTNVPKSAKMVFSKKWHALDQNSMFSKPHKSMVPPMVRRQSSSWSPMSSNVRPSKTVPHHYSSHSHRSFRDKPSYAVDDVSARNGFQVRRG